MHLYTTDRVSFYLPLFGFLKAIEAANNDTFYLHPPHIILPSMLENPL